MNASQDNQTLAGKRKRFASLYGIFLVALTVSFDGLMTWTLWVIAARIQHRLHPLAPPAPVLLSLLYIAGGAGLLGCILWRRSRAATITSLPSQEFLRQTQIGLTVSSVCFCLAPIWVFLGGAWSQAAPLLAGQAAVILLCVLPVVLKYGISLR